MTTRVGIIGCGKIADTHAEQIERIPDCRIEAVCDTEPLMAEQLGERYSVPGVYADVGEMLAGSDLDVVNITTPPQSHYSLGRMCLEAGCSILVEKPFTIDAEEAEALVDIAGRTGEKVTVGHTGQFTHGSLRARRLIGEGYLGGPPLHMESVFCYNLGDPRYAKAMLGDRDHWVRQLPGKLLHNIVSHGLCKIAEFLQDPDPEVVAHGFSSPLLVSIGETEIIDELRVIIRDKITSATAYFTFSTSINPPVHQFRAYGPERALMVDDDRQTVVRIDNWAYKSYLNQWIPPLKIAGEYVSNTARNFWKFLGRDFHIFSGHKNLIESFVAAVRDDRDPPIPYDEILRTARIMDSIFGQIYPVDKG